MGSIEQKSLGLDNKQKTNEQQPGPMATTGAMTPGNVPTQSRVASYSTGQSQTPGSGRFTNLQSYINANKPAGEQLGQKIAGKLGSSLETTEKQTSKQASDISSNIQAEKARIGEAAGFAKQIEEDPTKITNPQPTQIEGVQSETPSIAQPVGPSAYDRFKPLYAGTSSADQLKAQAGTAEANAINQYGTVGKNIANLGNEQGRFDLLKQSIKQPNYSAGQQNLDQLFLQTANPQALAQQQQNLQSRLGQSQTAAQNAYQGTAGINANFIGDNSLGAQATGAKTQLTNALTGATDKFNAEQVAEVASLNARNVDTQNALDTLFKQGYGTLSDAQKLIIDPMLQSGNLTAGTSTYNVLSDPNAYQNYMTGYNAPTASTSDVINQQDLARIQSLQQLSGITPDKYTYTQAGTGGVQTGLNTGKLTSAIESARTAIPDVKVDTTNLQNLLNNSFSTGSYSVLTPELLKNMGTISGLQDAYAKVTEQMDPQTLAILNGQAPPSNWNWSQGDLQRYLDSMAWYPEMVKEINQAMTTAGASNTLGRSSTGVPSAGKIPLPKRVMK